MKKIIITQFKDCKQAGLGHWEYMYFIHFGSPDYNYTIHASEEGIMRITKIFKEAGYEVEEIEKE